MTTEYVDNLEEPESGAWVAHAVVSAVTLAALAAVVVALLWPVGRGSGPAPGAAHRAVGTAARDSPHAAGDAAALQLRPSVAVAAAPRPEQITVYLVASAADAEALGRLRAGERGTDGLPADELVLVMDTPEAEAWAETVMRDLALHDPGDVVRVVDLRGP
jgi:hypothetical protein